MKTRSVFLSAAFAALLFVGAGCGSKAPAPAAVPDVNQAVEKPSSPGLPRMTEQPLDEDDHLDEALKDLDIVE